MTEPVSSPWNVVRAGLGRSAALALLTASVALAGCSSSNKTPPRQLASAQQTNTKEYFSEKAYGVKASPRVTTSKSRLRRGGGRDQVGKPYKIKGRWYHPKEEPGYSKTGKASWYGAAFHGRLTANGEIYDMTHLTAAHPTMPLPSYARVTNLDNGSSVVVRVNDRGPFAHGRIIDLSKRTAELLDFTHSGTADVKVDYIGRAPLHGQDDAYLMASYQPAGGRRIGPAVPQPSSDVMIAMNGKTPIDTRSPAAMAMAMTANGAPAPGDVLVGRVPASAGLLELPVIGPILGLRPPTGIPAIRVAGAPVLSYADIRIARANSSDAAFSTLIRDIDPQRLREAVSEHHQAPWRVFVGTFEDSEALESAHKALAGRAAGRIVEPSDGDRLSLFVRARTAEQADAIVADAWRAGYSQAFSLLPAK